MQGVNILSQSGLKTLRVIMNKVQQLGELELDLQISATVDLQSVG